MNGVCIVPAFLNIFSSHRHLNKTMKTLTWLSDIATVLMQLSIFFIPYMVETKAPNPTSIRWQLPLALCLISLGYWESFAEIRPSKQHFMQWFHHGIRMMKKTRPKIYITASLVKMIVLILIAFHFSPDSINISTFREIFDHVPIGQNRNSDQRLMASGLFSEQTDLFRSSKEVYIPLLVQVISSCICYYTGRIACKVTKS